MRFFETTHGIRHRTNRPTGTLPEENRLTEMLKNVGEYAANLSSNHDVIGITLNGGLSRGYGDALSEIDLNIYIKDERLMDWVKGKGPLPQGDHMGTRYHMDVSFLSLTEEKQKWCLGKKWDASYAKIIYDPTGQVEQLFEENDVFTADEKYGVALGNYLDCVYFGDIAVKQWNMRGDPLAAHMLINKGIPALINLLFLANDEFPPFEKWLLNYSYSLEWKPVDWEKRLEHIILIHGHSSEEVERRSMLFIELYREVWAKIVGEENANTGLLELDTLECLEYIIKESPSVTDFVSKYDIRQLGYENLFKLTDIVVIDDADVVRFNRERFNAEKAKGFTGFLDWNRVILNNLRL